MFWDKETKINTNLKDIDKILERGVISEILPNKDEFKKLLITGKRLHLYWGVDATSPNLHLSHAKNFLLLEEFRSLGHKTTILFGDFTARIGDPTDRENVRSKLSKEEVLRNIEKWKELISPIVDFKDKNNPPNIELNGAWLSKLSFENILELASNFTVQQMLERDMFQKRIREEKPIYLQEFFYPLMQGYDSVALGVDIECCGTDQTFNALVGRTLLKKLKNKDKFVVTVNLMENPKTKELMSKSAGTGVFLDATANEMYGSIMAQPDEMTEVLYINVTRLPLEQLEEKKWGSPKEFKMFVAKDIVKRFYGENSAEKAEKNWVDTFSKKIIPDDILNVNVKINTPLVDVLLENKLVESKSDFRRLLDAGAITIDGDKKILSYNSVVDQDEVIKIGKRKFLKVKIIRD